MKLKVLVALLVCVTLVLSAGVTAQDDDIEVAVDTEAVVAEATGDIGEIVAVDENEYDDSSEPAAEMITPDEVITDPITESAVEELVESVADDSVVTVESDKESPRIGKSRSGNYQAEDFYSSDQDDMSLGGDRNYDYGKFFLGRY